MWVCRFLFISIIFFLSAWKKFKQAFFLKVLFFYRKSNSYLKYLLNEK